MSTPSRDSSSATVFDIHLLQAQICEQLSPRDIRRCSLVSRNFYQNFAPYLYHSININRRSTFNRFCRSESIDALQRYRHHVHQVSCYFAEIWKIIFNSLCPNLTVIKSPSLKNRPQNQESNKEYVPYIIALIQTCPRLQVLEMGHFLYANPIAESFCQAIREHETLRELEIDHFSYVLCRVVRLILWSSYKLERLSINLAVSDYSNRNGTLEVMKALDDLTGQENPAFRIKNLTFRGNIYDHEIFTFIRFLERCPDLERLSLPSMYPSKIIDVASCKMVNLRHLDISSMDLGGMSIINVIESCQNLSSYVGGNTINLETYILESLKKCHSESLQELDMSRTFRFGRYIQETLCSFPNLKILKLMTPYSKIHNRYDEAMAYEFGGPILDVGELINDKRSWVCQGLRVLTLWYTSTLDSIEELDDNDGDDEDDIDDNAEGEERWKGRAKSDYKGVFPKVLYEQLGQLTELDVLWLGRREVSTRDPISYADIISSGDIHSSEADQLLKARNIDEGYSKESMRNGLKGLSRLSKLENLQLRRMKEHITKDITKEARTQWPSIKRMLIT